MKWLYARWAFAMLLALLASISPMKMAHADTQTVKIQFIDVCGVPAGGSTSCAPDSQTQLQSYVTYADAIYAQAGIKIAPVVDTNNQITVNQITINQLAAGSPYGACGGGAASVFCADSSGSTLFDTVHDLELTPGNGQSTSPTTLNVFLVNGIINTNNGVPVTGALVKGWGLIGGNGLVIATGTSGGATAAVDTMSHEIGHNLGLQHVTNVDDLMASGTRVVPVATCQVGVYTCVSIPIDPATGLPTTAGKTALDVLTNLEVGNYTNPVSGASVAQGQLTVLGQSLLINQLPNITTKVPDPIAAGSSSICNTTSPYCYIWTGSTSMVGGLLKDVQFRFLDPSVVVKKAFLFHTDSLGNRIVDSITVNIKFATYTDIAGATHIDWTVTPSGGLPANEEFEIAYTFPSAPSPLSPYDYTPPFSTAFDFVDGTTLTSGFDLTSNSFQSSQAQVASFNPDAPGAAVGPSILPTDPSPSACPTATGLYGCVEDTDNHTSPLAVIYDTPISPFAEPINVPEPLTWPLLGAAASGIALLRGYRGRRSVVSGIN